MQLTRRKIARVLTFAAAAPLAKPQAPAAAAPADDADQNLREARQSLRSAAAAVARVPLPMSAEPIIKFRA